MIIPVVNAYPCNQSDSLFLENMNSGSVWGWSNHDEPWTCWENWGKYAKHPVPCLDHRPSVAGTVDTKEVGVSYRRQFPKWKVSLKGQRMTEAS